MILVSPPHTDLKQQNYVFCITLIFCQAYLERQALEMGITHLFLLSTRTMQWFEERGFVSVCGSL